MGRSRPACIILRQAARIAARVWREVIAGPRRAGAGWLAEHVGAQLVARDLPADGGFDGDASGRTDPAAAQPLGDVRLCFADTPGQGGLPAGQGYGP